MSITQACPRCKDISLRMNCPKGNRFSKNSKEYSHQDKASFHKSRYGYHRKEIHGLSQCNKCLSLWSRDYVGSIIIHYRSFVSSFLTGAAPIYLQKMQKPTPTLRQP